jgi:cholesterol oxidase
VTTDKRPPDARLEASYDVAIIGSGFGGSISANRLSVSGLNVLVLERGPWRDSLPVRALGIAERSPFPYGTRFATHFLRSINIGLSNTPATVERGYPKQLPARGFRVLRNLIGTRGRGVLLNKRGMYELFSYPGIDVVCVSAVGGGSHGWLGLLVEPCNPLYWENRHPDLRTEHISRYYGKIRSDLCTTRLTRQHPVPQSVWAELPGLAGQRCQPADPQPESAYLYPQFDNDAGRMYEKGDGLPRRICAFDGDGFLGSRDGAKSSVDFAYLAPALNNGVTIQALCEARRVVREPDSAGGGYVVHYRDLREKRNSTARAKRVVLAAGTMNTLRLLFEGQRRNDLAVMPSLGSTFGGNGDAIGVCFKNSAGPATLPAPPVLGQFRVDGADSPFFGLAAGCGLDTLPLPRWAKRRLEHMMLVFAMGADSGNASVHCVRGRLEIDYDGAKEPVFDHIADGFDALKADLGLRVSARRKPVTVHAWGGACLGPDSDHGVVNHHGEVYGNPGLFIADAAALPAAVGAPPSLAIAAWAHHVADQLAKTISRHPPLITVDESTHGAK